jgi:hypothetical protein
MSTLTPAQREHVRNLGREYGRRLAEQDRQSSKGGQSQ